MLLESQEVTPWKDTSADINVNGCVGQAIQQKLLVDDVLAWECMDHRSTLLGLWKGTRTVEVVKVRGNQKNFPTQNPSACHDTTKRVNHIIFCGCTLYRYFTFGWKKYLSSTYFLQICHSEQSFDAVKDGEELDHINNRFAIYCFGSLFPNLLFCFSGKFVK